MALQQISLKARHADVEKATGRERDGRDEKGKKQPAQNTQLKNKEGSWQQSRTRLLVLQMVVGMG